MTDKRRVTMTTITALPPDSKGRAQTARHEAVDYVPVDILDVYVADARTRWQLVEVSDDVDHGPGGKDGDTVRPVHLTGA